MKPLAFFFAVALSCSALSQVTPFEFGVGLGLSGSFERSSGGQGRIEGLELSASQSYLKLPFAGEIRVGVSALLDGALGDGEDGRVYRLFAHYKSPSVGPQGLYVLAGPFWGRAQGRSSSFESFDRSGIDVGVGVPLSSPLRGVVATSLELVVHQSSRPQLRAWSLGLRFRL